MVMRKYSKTESMDIGRRIYEGELTVAKAAVLYDVDFYTARNYLRNYKAYMSLKLSETGLAYAEPGNRKELEKLKKSELIDIIISMRSS